MGNRKGEPRFNVKKPVEPYTICMHPKYGAMRYTNGWLQKINDNIKFKIEKVLEFNDNLPVVISDITIERKVEYKSNMRISTAHVRKKRMREKCTPSREKNRRTCHYCNERYFKANISFFKGKFTCDKCMEKYFIATDEQDMMISRNYQLGNVNAGNNGANWSW